jgi:hypothetical protein
MTAGGDKPKLDRVPEHDARDYLPPERVGVRGALIAFAVVGGIALVGALILLAVKAA